MDLSVELFGIRFKNPVWVASGTFGYGVEAAEIYDISKLGAVVTKGLSLKERLGNETPRIVETPCGMLNSIGLQNPGVEKFLKEIYPKIKDVDTHFIANVFGETEEEYVEVCMALEDADKIVAYELNVSCPNVKKGGILFGHDPVILGNLVDRIKAKIKKPLLVKLSPNVTDVTEFAKVCIENGADGLVLINTLMGMKINIWKRKPDLATKTGGLSGPAILPIAVRMIYQVYEKFGDRIPIIGVGGITTWEDAMEHVMAGASAVQVGTANFYEPLAPLKVIEGIENFMKSQNIKDFKELIGIAHRVE
ncbi:dihydroorotate dehydrogenase [Aquifex aeolicus]|uniref:Putative dihydroorotate dehydrogenase A (fumarate) n=1 Tax=Aquifex aeolicus (strain VF5) TaxID=224324 RepID=PYRDA_AQUAE|nr:dihydroorotate dehydrogenase [Aquifex aeolicus]O66461.1 RecName: Full=Putative dihydroorotate dehydrogenase A (fumarate); Short=DHOD A; Short=DHODase A; Short=DHOdehase A [Aquifex aeolicus VF5]AAC06426.1 dihydroorotase dehydrogenase [Aquifex aeolicus VF5]